MYGKLLIRCELEVVTGLHIGDSSAFSAIGAVDSPVVRDPLSSLPIIPGSSLKGKLRTLLARSRCQDIENMPDFPDDDADIRNLFGFSNSSNNIAHRSRLQFADAFLLNADELSAVGVTEIKTENAIQRANSVANLRQIERVIAGAKFDVRIVYDISDENQMLEDMELLAKGLKLLQMDYLGGHGSRGSGRVRLNTIKLQPLCSTALDEETLACAQEAFDGVEHYDLFSV